MDEPEPLVEEEFEPIVEKDPELTVEEELLDEDPLDDDPLDDDPLDEDPLDEDLVWEEVVLPLEAEERLSCEYESTGAASMASTTADARAIFRIFFMMIRC